MNVSRQTHKLSIDMTLRMWSDQVPLKPLLDSMNVTIKHLQVLGEPSATEGRFAGRMADRHYASIANERGRDDNDLSAWLARIIDLIEPQKNLVDKFRNGQVEALIWIAAFGNDFKPTPLINFQILDSYKKLGIQILFENYTDFDDEGIAKKIWIS